MGPTWGRQDPGGPHVGPMNIAMRDVHSTQIDSKEIACMFKIIGLFLIPHEVITIKSCTGSWKNSYTNEIVWRWIFQWTAIRKTTTIQEVACCLVWRQVITCTCTNMFLLGTKIRGCRIENKSLMSGKFTWKCRLQNSRNFVHTWMR